MSLTPSFRSSLAVTTLTMEPRLCEKAADLAARLHVPHLPADSPALYELRLIYGASGLFLQQYDQEQKAISGCLQVDFQAATLTYRRMHGGGVKQPLARAVGIKGSRRPRIIDVTAGLGQDSFLLASLGCQVIMVERSPLLAALLRDGLERASADPTLQEIVSRLSLVEGDGRLLLGDMVEPGDTVYLDPMYPHRRKSALNRQCMRIIRSLVGEDEDGDSLLLTALEQNAKRVVVKRPKGAPLLAPVAPSHVITMKNSRYDVYIGADRHSQVNETKEG